MSERVRTWTARGGTARSAAPVRGGPGAEKLLENLRRMGADDWMIRSVEASVRKGRTTTLLRPGPSPNGRVRPS